MSRVTSRVTVHVSHATTTTPHYTISWAEVACGWFVAKKSSIVKAVEGHVEKRMNGYAEEIRGLR